jgi:hypothetical protein
MTCNKFKKMNAIKNPSLPVRNKAKRSATAVIAQKQSAIANFIGVQLFIWGNPGVHRGRTRRCTKAKPGLSAAPVQRIVIHFRPVVNALSAFAQECHSQTL